LLTIMHILQKKLPCGCGWGCLMKFDNYIAKAVKDLLRRGKMLG
jgi:hypothetical protein